ncbi:MAG: hypothetical protein M1820_004834 [Bogoriella megaspora]|nr:MAG: hypothetical protein M1820_004834 [Bogoriella megaspora]
MAASRTTSLRTITKLTATQTRTLHMTGPSTFPSPMLTSERPAFSVPTDLAGMRAECQKRNLPMTGNRAELRDRLAADELVKSRSFSTALNSGRRPSSSSPSTDSSKSVRELNTSCSVKAVNDTSTVDFAYLPAFEDGADRSASVRVPIGPDAINKAQTFKDIDDEVHRPQISTSSADIHPQHLAEVHDNSAASVDYGRLADAPAMKNSELKSKVENVETGFRAVWSGFLDDLLGPKRGAKTA